jgi:hypothetical protein
MSTAQIRTVPSFCWAAATEISGPETGQFAIFPWLDTIVDEVTAIMIEKHPDWTRRDWIKTGVGCLCSEHPSDDEHPGTGEHSEPTR